MRNAISEIVNQTLDRLIVSNPKNKTNEFKKYYKIKENSSISEFKVI